MSVSPAISRPARLRQQQVLKLMGELDVLPTTVNIPIRVLRLRRSGVSSTADFAAVLSTDQSLCSKVLGLANSSYFSPARPVRKVSDAVAMIGLNNLLSLVLGMSLAGIFNKLGLSPSSVTALWRGFLLKSVAAKEYANRYAPDVAEEAGICGLVQDMALPVMQAADQSVWANYQVYLDMPEATRLEREQSLFGLDHTQFGAMLAQRLALPEIYRTLTRTHHADLQAARPGCSAELARACMFAAALPHRVSDRPDVERVKPFIPAGPQQDAEAAALLKSTLAAYRQMLEMLGEEDENGAAFKDFVREVTSEVARCLTSAIGESAARIQTLKTREATLEEKVQKLEEAAIQSEFDSLTGVLTRPGWLKRCGRLFALCREHQMGCAIGFVDVDNFKQVNDVHGHALGDQALKWVGHQLQQSMSSHGIAGRLGGDEFAFAVVARDEGELKSLLSSTAKQFEQFSLPAEGGRLTISTSVGAFWVGIPAPDLSVETALESADKLMYDAKRGGKGRCVFGQLRNAA